MDAASSFCQSEVRFFVGFDCHWFVFVATTPAEVDWGHVDH